MLFRSGEKSFWKPYLDILPKTDLLAFWTDKELTQLQDPELIQEAKRYKEDLNDEWENVKSILEKYPKLFPMDKVNKELFYNVYENVVTRCFGWSLPCTMLIPVADALNHSSVDASNELIDLDIHKEAIEGISKNSDLLKQYITKSKMTIDFSDFKKVSSNAKGDNSIKSFIIDDDTTTICNDIRKLNINTENYNIWNVYCLCENNRGFYSSSDTEDNDSNDEKNPDQDEEADKENIDNKNKKTMTKDLVIEDYSKISSSLETELSIDKYTKYKIMKQGNGSI